MVFFVVVLIAELVWQRIKPWLRLLVLITIGLNKSKKKAKKKKKKKERKKKKTVF